MLKAGTYGFGGIGRAHKKSYEILSNEGVPIKLAAACDITPERLTKDIEINISINSNIESTKINTYPSIDEMLANEDLDIISICLPTYLHADAAIDMLERGYHVLSEKPMALSSADCKRMLEAARKAKRNLMIGQCMRFRQDCIYLKELVEKGTYGKVISAYFNRLASPPLWAWENWFMDYDKSGGCIFDLHIHDVDFIRFIFGDPKYVSCVSHNVLSKYDSNCSRFIYDDDKFVTATGDWSLSRHFGFHQTYRIAFEKATLTFDGEEAIIYVGDNQPVPIPVEITDCMVNEIRFFIDMILNGTQNTSNRPEDSAGTIALIEQLRESADSNGQIIKV